VGRISLWVNRVTIFGLTTNKLENFFFKKKNNRIIFFKKKLHLQPKKIQGSTLKKAGYSEN
jgi:hypothetical protein